MTIILIFLQTLHYDIILFLINQRPAKQCKIPINSIYNAYLIYVCSGSTLSAITFFLYKVFNVIIRKEYILSTWRLLFHLLVLKKL